MDITYIGPVILLLFTFITFIISAYEKVNGWQMTKDSFQKQFIHTVFSKTIVPILILILILEVTVVTFAARGIWNILTSQNFDYASYAFITASILYILLLIGLRTINDYAGASRIAMYFLISIFGLFWIQSI